jgi:hypothetical protein
MSCAPEIRTWDISMSYLFYSPGPTGCGKTHAAENFSVDMARNGHKVVVVQPTTHLLNQTVAGIIAKAPEVRVRAIHGENTQGVLSAIVQHLKDAQPGGEVLLITHSAFERLPYFHGRRGWHAVLDEATAAEFVFEFNLAESHTLFSHAVAVKPFDAEYGEMVAVDRNLINRIARNTNGDEVFSLLSTFANRLLSQHWRVFTPEANWHAMLDGRGDAEHRKLRVHGVLSPSLLEGFATATVLCAAFQNTLLYRLWAAQNVQFKPDKLITRHLRYQQHPNGPLLTINYLTVESWSKRFRDRMLDDGAGTVMSDAVQRIKTAMKGEPFVWLANKDVPDDLFEQANAVRLPQVAHGRNDWMSFHNAVILSALNPPTSHFKFLERFGVSPDEAREAIFWQQAYQASTRISTRNPDDPNPKRIIVPDRDTANFIRRQFPGSPEPTPLGGSMIDAKKRKPGRHRLHTSNAEKQAVYRRRKREERAVATAIVNGLAVPDLGPNLQPIADRLRTSAADFAGETALNVQGIMATVYADVWSKDPLAHVALTDADEFIRHLGEMSQRIVEAKEDSGLITPAVMDPDKSGDTSRGLANVRAVWGLWFDFDGGDMTPEALADLFPRYRIAAFNTHSSTPEAPRWRAFIPTTMAMTRDIHTRVLSDLVRVMENAGWFSAEQIAAGRKNPLGVHGLDPSKFNAASMFYLPCRAAAGVEASFFHDFAGPRRAALDVEAAINRPVIAEREVEMTPRPRPAARPVVQPQPTIVLSPAMHAAKDKLMEQSVAQAAVRREEKVERAIDEWRSCAAGKGSEGFFKFGMALKRAGLEKHEIEAMLRSEAGYGRSPAERRAEVASIMRKV